jgi:hypothetical protein
MENEAIARGSVTRRKVISGIAGVGAAVITGTALARAQESTSTPESGIDSTTDTEDTTTPENNRETQYQTFLTKLAAALSITDTTTLDTGIRDALKGIIDDQLAAGDIAANAATEAKTAIDEATAPISFHLGLGGDFRNGGFGGQFGGPGMGGGGNGQFPGAKPDDGNNTETKDDTSEATPTA